VNCVGTVLQGGYWDLREQGGEADPPSLWRRYGFDFTEWYVARGKTYEAEIRDLADILAADERTLVVTLSIAEEQGKLVVVPATPGQAVRDIVHEHARAVDAQIAGDGRVGPGNEAPPVRVGAGGVVGPAHERLSAQRVGTWRPLSTSKQSGPLAPAL
jgi:hypothetical protein